MKLKTLIIVALLSMFSTSIFAENIDKWDYKTVTGNLKSTAGCKTKKKASAQASSGYRLKKYSQVLCQQEGYGWALSEIKDKGETRCDDCGGDYEGKYRCYQSNVTIQCKMVSRGW